MNKKIGLVLIIGSIILGFIDGFSLLISNFLGRIYCGDNYMQPVEGIVGDVSCGFNADMYFMAFLISVMLIGIALIMIKK